MFDTGIRRRVRRLKQAWNIWGPKVKQAWFSDSREITNHTYPITKRNRTYLAWLVSHVTGRSVDEIEGYFREIESDERVPRHVIERLSEGPWSHASDPRFDPGRRIAWYAIARALKPDVVVESGCERGFGAVCLIAALQRNGSGRYYGLDNNLKAGWLVSGEYAEPAKVLHGDAIETLKAFDKPIGLFVEDARHSLEFELAEYEAIRDKLAPGAVIVSDNAHVCLALERFARKTNRRFLYMTDEPIHWQQPASLGVAW